MSLALNINEVIAETGIGRSSIFEAIKDGRLRAKKFNRRTIVLRDDLQRFLASLPDRAIG